MRSALKNWVIEEWRHGWKLWSVQINAIGLVLLAVVEILREAVNYVPPSIINKLPHAETIATVCFVLGILVRLLRQNKKGS